MAERALPGHIRALLRPGALEPGGPPPELVQTHISYVLLTSTHAYKLKKPRNLGFLDYTTLEQRRAACEAEVRLNRRLTTNVYLDVQPVTRGDDGIRLGGAGVPLDWAVVMRRLPAGRMLDRLAGEDAIPPDLLTGLAARLARFYGEAATGGGIDQYAAPDALLANWQENLAQTLPYVGRTISRSAYLRIERAVYAHLLRLRPLWQERIAAGRARDGHGDLRLCSVCAEADGLQVYDCIEFNERFRSGDLAADIAFLTMDFDGHGRPDLGDEFLAAFVAASADRTLTAVLPFYRCYRAFVRGKVDSFQIDDFAIPQQQRRAARLAARGRFALAERYLRPPPARLAVVTGTAPVPRDAVATALAGRLGAALVDAASPGATCEVGRRLSQRIPVVLCVETAAVSAWEWVSAVGARHRIRPLMVICGDAPAPAGAVRLPGGLPVRETLHALHERLAMV